MGVCFIPFPVQSSLQIIYNNSCLQGNHEMSQSCDAYRLINIYAQYVYAQCIHFIKSKSCLTELICIALTELTYPKGCGLAGYCNVNTHSKLVQCWHQNVLKVPKVESNHYAECPISSFQMYKVRPASPASPLVSSRRGYRIIFLIYKPLGYRVACSVLA